MDVYNPLPKTVLTSIISLSMILWLQMQLACMLATICKWLKTPTCHPSMLTSIWLQTNIWQQQPKCWCRCFKMQNGEVMMAFMFVFISNILKVILLLYIFLFSFFFKWECFCPSPTWRFLQFKREKCLNSTQTVLVQACVCSVCFQVFPFTDTCVREGLLEHTDHCTIRTYETNDDDSATKNRASHRWGHVTVASLAYISVQLVQQVQLY